MVFLLKSNRNTSNRTYTIEDAPETIHDKPFYNLKLDEEQKEFVKAIYDKESLIVMCNAKAGTGKTTISIAVANILYQYGFYDGIVYIASPTMEQRQGFLPGDQEDKNAPYMEPLIEALKAIDINPMQVIKSSYNIQGLKDGSAYVTFAVDTYLRGCNFENKVVIIDEAQNFYGDDLKKVLTRIHDSCKTIVIGHTEQCDLFKHRERSGFYQYLNAFSKMDDKRIKICNLTTNHRGWVSTICDNVQLKI